MRTEEDFKAFPGIRWRLDVDGTAIATALGKARSRDHLYFHGPGKVGLYLERDTPRSFRAAARAYAREATVLEAQWGDQDGILILDASKPLPRYFFRLQPRGVAKDNLLYVNARLANGRISSRSRRPAPNAPSASI